MREDWPVVRLGDVTSQVRTREAPKRGQRYRLLGVRGKGLGAFLREEVEGERTRAVALTPTRAGQFTYNRLFAGSGSFGVIPPELEGCWVSNEFPVFEVDRSRLNVNFLRLLFEHPPTWERVAAECIGTTGSRMRWHERRFAEFAIELPLLAEQRRIVDLVDAVDAVADRVQSVVASATNALEAADASVVMGLALAPTVALAAIAEVVGGVTKDSKRDAEPNLIEVPYLRVANVQRGRLDLSQMATIKVSKSKVASLRLRSGDVLFNEGGDRDKLGRGWVWKGQIEPCIHQNHVLRARLTGPEFDPWFVSIWGNGPFGRVWFEENGAQTTNLASVSLSTLRRFPVPNIPLADQQRIAVLHLAIRDASRAARAVRDRVLALRSALLTDLLTGNREISASYDRFLDGAA